MRKFYDHLCMVRSFKKLHSRNVRIIVYVLFKVGKIKVLKDILLAFPQVILLHFSRKNNETV